ncbi:thiolase family protein [Sporosarcina highlanderae]|uniref:acetyl-CoA C-acetyltransferase n=1 Tax=Sporosarcina highlanderae TaxID=3035916 RepID=A0ABT8JLQ6_9BACL|nr:acetyl-CoA C-acetyltransferase [Sporosarcina highlanderae]MDN4605857.1 acetyl-CoA C-acetyltransferase [Sporosarcina highlanderae]
MKDVYIIDGARTPFAEFGGSFKNVTDIELAVHAVGEALRRSGILAEQVEEVVFGNVIHSNKASSYLARHIGLKSGIPIETPALTVNRLCGSGMQAIISATQTIRDGDASVAVAGGTENMSQAPHVLRNTRFGSAGGPPPIDDMLWDTLTDQYTGCGMGITAENLAEQYDISREEMDEFAVRSHQKAAAARESGRFEKEIVGVPIRTKKGEVLIKEDEHIRPDADLESLARLKTALKKDGTVTAGNASGINDGAAAVVLADGQWLSEHPEIQPLAKIVSWATAGVDPNIMGIGPVPAMKKALAKAGLDWDDIGLIEINEAFAAQSIAVINELGLDQEKVNVNGGAVALGHPVGTSGTRITYSLALEMQERNVQYGIASLCIGGGQGIAIVLERV